MGARRSKRAQGLTGTWLINIVLAALIIMPMSIHYSRVWDADLANQLYSAKTVMLNLGALVSLKGSATMHQTFSKDIQVVDSELNKQRLLVVDESGADFAQIIPFASQANQVATFENQKSKHLYFSSTVQNILVDSKPVERPKVVCSVQKKDIEKIAIVTKKTNVQQAIATIVSTKFIEVREDTFTDADVIISLKQSNQTRILTPKEFSSLFCEDQDKWNVIIFRDNLQRPNEVIAESNWNEETVKALIETIGDAT